jgi:SagB-type dehydrogenase family enzyme
VLGLCSNWKSSQDLAQHLPRFSQTAIEREVEALSNATMLDRRSEPPHEREPRLRDWGNWAPAAAFFHLATRNQQFVDSKGSGNYFTAQPQPPVVKTYPTGARIELPPFAEMGALPEVLLQRRTWRRFGSDAISLDSLATLCGLTFAVQSWMVFDGVAPQALKTSPSGGARHSIEAYVCVQRVEGVQSGIYHYGADSHDLALLRPGLDHDDFRSFLPAQPWYTDAAAVVFMTSVFARVQWRYKMPRAYRNIFIEAGHLAQTFCLLGTWLGLAPFSTAALSEDAIEAALGIDGVSEGVLYAVGVGVRPSIEGWGSLPPGRAMPGIVPAGYRQRV